MERLLGFEVFLFGETWKSFRTSRPFDASVVNTHWQTSALKHCRLGWDQLDKECRQQVKGVAWKAGREGSLRGSLRADLHLQHNL